MTVLAVAMALVAAVAGPSGAAGAASATRMPLVFVGPAVGGPDVSGATTVGALPYSDSGSINASAAATKDAVYKVALTEGQSIFVEAKVTSGSGSVGLFLWSRDTTTVKGDLSDDKVVAATPYEHAPNFEAPLRLQYVVPAGAAGTYYIDIWASQGSATYDLVVKQGAIMTVKPLAAVTYGRQFTLSGTIAPLEAAHAGTTIEAWARYQDIDQEKLSLLGSGQVAADGSWKIPVRSPSLTMPWGSIIRIEWAGDANHGGVDSALSTKVRPKITIRARPARVRPRAKVTITGKVAPSAATLADATRTRLTIQGRIGRGRWKNLKTFNVAPSGVFKFFYGPTRAGAWQFRAFYKTAVFKTITGTTYFRYINGYSGVAKVTVR